MTHGRVEDRAVGVLLDGPQLGKAVVHGVQLTGLKLDEALVAARHRHEVHKDVLLGQVLRLERNVPAVSSAESSTADSNATDVEGDR